MNDSGMHFGCHGINHIRWKSWNFNQQKREIESSKKFFKSKKIHTKNFSVCYPWGSYNNISSKVLKTLDIKFGLTSDKGNFKVNSKLNRFILPRFDANDFLNI